MHGVVPAARDAEGETVTGGICALAQTDRRLSGLRAWPGLCLNRTFGSVATGPHYHADADGVIRYWNHGAAQVFGSNASETLGQPPDIIIPAGTSGATPASGSCVATFW
jgi:hypothetical protein